MIKLLIFLLIAGCASVPSSPEPEEPDVSTPPEKAPEPDETPEETFDREYDACWVTYRQCLKDTPGSRKEQDVICFPPHEKCCVTAYRKLKKSRERS